ncbi:hypothetical protein OKW40_003631 [Paraburkholderia sp. RAU6.4a]|uniref:hypothetical protein n=1 Tax=Paraburkholderia sp. RAU6.4a TaxID=2991067 RepID=UPI003D21027D
MVYVFFCVSGALGPLNLNICVSKSQGTMANLRQLDRDVALLTKTLRAYPGAVIVAGNSWPFYYDFESIRQAFSELGSRVVNAVKTLADRQEEAVLGFMSNRAEPFVVLASPEFEFSNLTESRRVDVDTRFGFDEAARSALLAQMRDVGEPAIRPLSYDDMLRATVSGLALRRTKRMLSRLHASEDVQFQQSLRSILGEG